MAKKQFRFRPVAAVTQDGIPVVIIQMPDADGEDDRERHLTAATALELSAATWFAAAQAMSGTVALGTARADGFKEEGQARRAKEFMEGMKRLRMALSRIHGVASTGLMEEETWLQENIQEVLKYATETAGAGAGPEAGGDSDTESGNRGAAPDSAEFCDGDLAWFADSVQWTDTNKA